MKILKDAAVGFLKFRNCCRFQHFLQNDVSVADLYNTSFL